MRPRFDTVLGFHPVRDLAATRDFYERDLGLRLEREMGRCLVFAAGSGYVGFRELADAHPSAAAALGPDAPAGLGDPGSGPIAITFVTDHVDAIHDRLRRLGVELEGPPRRRLGDGVYGFSARDPDGYRVEVQRFDEPLR